MTLMGGEILNAALLSFGLIFVGWALGELLLKVQGGKEESL
jgi:cytochrome b6-f complex subunit 7